MVGDDMAQSTYSGKVQNTTPPNLPAAPAEYSAQYVDQLNNVLRLYFNTLNNVVNASNSVTLSVYANNAAAIAGGLKIGAFYRTGSNPDYVCVVH